MPDWKAEIARRLAGLKLEPAREAEIAEELAQHLEDRFRELVSGGAGEEQAQSAALAELSDEQLLAKGLRQVEQEAPEKPVALGGSGGRNFLSSVWQDIRYGLRQLRRKPGFAGFVILTLALGIGATTAIFSVVDRVLLEPMPYPHPNRIAIMVRRIPSRLFSGVSIPEYMVWRSETRILGDITAIGTTQLANLLGGNHPEQLQAGYVTANFFALFGVRVMVGRTFTTEEDVPGGPAVAVISQGLWRQRFGSDPQIVGKVIDLDKTAYTVIGVVSPFPVPVAETADVYLPLRPNPNSPLRINVRAFGRLKPGVTVAQADAALKVATEQFRRQHPHVLGSRETFATMPLGEAFVSGVRELLLIFLGAVGFVLLIACVNVANLLLGRETGRQREIAIREALGASRGRIVRQILTESILLSLVGGAAGLLVGYAGVRALLALSPVQLPWVGQHGEAVTLDWRVLLFALGISALAGALAGLVPAVKASHTNLAATMNESGSRTGTGMRHNKTRSLLVVAEMALAMVLLAGAGLLIRTFRDLRSVKPGFQTHNILTMDMSLTGAHFAKTAAVAELVRDGEQRLDSLPGVAVAAAASCCLPLQGGSDFVFSIEGRAPTDGRYAGVAEWRSVSPGYFQAFGIPLLRGRAFTVNDSGSSQPVIIINEAMAKRYWLKGGELGTRITIAKYAGPPFADLPREIVGVVGDVRDIGLEQMQSVPTMYVPVAQQTNGLNAHENSFFPLTWIIRTRVAPLSLSHEVQKQLLIASGGLPVGRVRTMGQVEAHSTEQNSFNMTLLVIFAGLALLLAAVGIYGVLAYSVEQRTQEIGIRMALGASPGRVRRTIAAQGMALALVGVAIGVGGGLALTRLLRSLLFGVKPTDPLAFVAATLVLVGAALLACYLPARRATRVDPVVALRCE